jgi:hypothetical protein
MACGKNCRRRRVRGWVCGGVCGFRAACRRATTAPPAPALRPQALVRAGENAAGRPAIDCIGDTMHRLPGSGMGIAFSR